jgi:hypothetical protein
MLVEYSERLAKIWLFWGESMNIKGFSPIKHFISIIGYLWEFFL